jgi:hypothetical protein
MEATMRACGLSGLVMILALAGTLAAGRAQGLQPGTPGSAPAVEAWPEVGIEVDVALVLAVDISYSMDPEELALQRDGYIAALTAPPVLDAIRKGMIGKIGVTYLEWAGTLSQFVVVDWKVIDSEASARAFADALAAAPLRRARRTSISGAIGFSMAQLGKSPFRPLRRVIDISGDGPNNEGAAITAERDKALRRGVVINGLPIVLSRARSSYYDIDGLDEYYEDCVIGGPGAFMIVISEKDQFRDAIKSKILREVAQNSTSDAPATGARGRSDCLIGEKMWRRNWDGGN